MSLHNRRLLLLGGAVLPPGLFSSADVYLDPTSNFYYQKGGYNGLTWTRASAAYIDDTSGNWSLVGNNTPRVSNKGWLIEESRTNSLPNNSMTGAVAGTPGTVPTGWSTSTIAQTDISNLTTTNGMDTIDIHCSSATSITNAGINFISTTTAAALYGQIWTGSVFVALVAGSLTNVSVLQNQLLSRPDGLNASSSMLGITSTLTRFASSLTFTASTAAFAQQRILYTTTGAYDFTLRIGWPQIENNNINSTVSSAVAASAGSGYNVGDTITLTGGAGTQAILTVATLTGGAGTGVATVTVNSAGSYTTLPPSPASQGSTSGAGTGATFTLTPASNTTQAFATSPIRTTTVAATRAADSVVMTTPPTYGTAYTIFSAATPIAPVSYGKTNQVALLVSDGSANNRLSIQRLAFTGNASATSTSGGVTSQVNSLVWNQSTLGKLALGDINGAQSFVFNGGTVGTQTGNLPVNVSQTNIGVNQAGNAGFFSGYISKIAIWGTSKLADATLQGITT